MSSYYTKYFENEDLNAIKTSIDTVINYLNQAKTSSGDIESTYLNGSVWTSDSVTKVSDAFSENNTKIDELVSKLEKFKTIIDSANGVVTMQDKMDTIANYDELVSKASSISSSRDLLDCTGKKVLIVDDGEVNIRIASKYLEQYNFTIETATNGKDCIEMVKANQYDIVFLDHMMPEMDGVATIKALYATGYKLPPIIALTANSYTGLETEYISQGFSGYLQKPIDFKELNKIINGIFRDKDGKYMKEEVI